MRIPVIRGVIDRRILANFHVDADVLARVLPSPFRPRLVEGRGIAGICLIRLRNVRPRVLPSFVGFRSENAAHRIAVEWDENGTVRQGVYVHRRDTSSRLNVLLGGRLFPGVHHHARFAVREADDDLSVVLQSDDGEAGLTVEGRVTDKWPATSVFDSMEDASSFFECGTIGYSPASVPGQFDGLELRTLFWHVEPLDVSSIRSSYFENKRLFPDGSAEFDCALLMRNIPHEWHGMPAISSETFPNGLAAAHVPNSPASTRC